MPPPSAAAPQQFIQIARVDFVSGQEVTNTLSLILVSEMALSEDNLCHKIMPSKWTQITAKEP